MSEKGHIRQRGKKWVFVVYLGRDSQGKPKYHWSKGFATKSLAEKNRRIYVRDLEESPSGFLHIEPMTLSEHLDKWLFTYGKINLKQSTFEGYRTYINVHIKPALGDTPLRRLNPMMIQDFYYELLESGRVDGKGGLKAKTVLQIHRILHKSLKNAVVMQLISRNPAEGLDLPRIKKEIPNTLKSAEISEVLKFFKGTDYFMPVLIALLFGMRRGEVLGLRWTDINFEENFLVISQTLLRKNGGYYFSTPKTDSSIRGIPFGDKFKEVLLRHKLIQESNKKKLKGGYQDLDLVCCREDGSILKPDSFSKSFQNIMKKNGYPDISFHDLRHTNATLMLKSGVPAKIAADRLGHSTVLTTLDIYSHTDIELLRGTSNKFEDDLL